MFPIDFFPWSVLSPLLFRGVEIVLNSLQLPIVIHIGFLFRAGRISHDGGNMAQVSSLEPIDVFVHAAAKLLRKEDRERDSNIGSKLGALIQLVRLLLVSKV